MANYVLSCCSTADLTVEHLRRRNISFVCFHFSLDGVEYADDMGQSMAIHTFYEKMIAGAETSTSQVSVGEFCEYFTGLLSAGNDVLHICLSSGLSGSYSSAVSAAEMMKEQFPDRKIYVVDSLCASSGYGLFMDGLADQRDKGLDLEALRDWAEENKLRMQHWFFSTDLKWYVKGGRVSAPAGFIGGILGICPVLHMDAEGHLIPFAKARTKKKAIKAVVDQMIALADGGTDYNGKCYICNSYCLDDARATAELVEKTFPHLNGAVEIYDIGTVIGSHTGPGTISIFFWGSPRE